MKKKALWVLVVVLGIACLCGSHGCREQERVALLALNATLDLQYRVDVGGSYFNCCSWEGVECNPTTGRVTQLMLSHSRYYRFGSKTWYLNASLLLPFEELKSLSLSDNYLGGWIAPEEPNLLSSRLSKLEVLDVSHNSLGHSILSVLNTIPSLRHVLLHDNNLSGTLHVNGDFSNLMELDIRHNAVDAMVIVEGGFSNLKELDMSDNPIDVAAIAKGLCNLIKLEELDLSINKITGGLPMCWRNMTSIRVLFLEDNEFTDNVASSPLTSLTSLELLSISGNYFDIPLSLGPLANYSRLKVLLLDDNKPTIDSKVASLIPRFQLKVFSMSNSLLKGFKVTSLGFLNHQYDLRTIDLSSNDILGPFPAWLLENNTKLEKLFMANNLFATLEVPLMTLHNLLMMDISNNGMRGELTTEFCLNVPNMYHLNLSTNRLEGNIPYELASIKSLFFLDLSHNNFSKGLPIQLLDNSSSLYNLNVAYNNLQGEIVFSNDTMNLNFLCLQLEHNMFTGDLSFLSSLLNLLLLDGSNNFFIGKLPRLIANTSLLVFLDLSQNQLNGLIPQELFNLTQLKYLALSDNNLSGLLASSFIAPALSHIHLNGNKLNGSIMHVLFNSSNLVTLDLSENEFFGSIPYWLGTLSQLSILSLRGNSFYGTFPEQLCRLKSLSMIDLSENNMFGPLPSCLGPMNFSSGGYANKVTSLPLGFFGGGVEELSPWSYVRSIRSHTEFYHYKSLVEQEWQVLHIVGFTTKRRFDAYKGYALLNMVGLDFSCNHFSGEIPLDIAISQDMLVLNLSHNKLTGHIPMSLSNLTKIESIDLSYNNLIGSIPEELTQLNFLGVFNVSYNDLSGAIPNKNQFGSFDESSYYGNHLLCGLPLSNDCSTTININCSATKSCRKAKEDGFIDGETFYISFGVSYMTVLLVIPVVLFINPQWRQGWFHYVELVITTCKSLFITCYYFVQDGF
ncbi:receptor-like protein 9b [Eucalyptus grandis]|uniref:receptor-like protein 9b n=1 Tax=Eucalyptus grandis TaxID=71139 RepID=UPI00192F0642|nr:receptor-like protein 9b [Eucalyptus grandis]